MKRRIVDSWAIIAWMLGQGAASQIVLTLLSQAEVGEVHLTMSAINAGEVYYTLLKRGHQTQAESWHSFSPTFPITFEVPNLRDIWQAAELKARFPISYADSFAAVLAQKHRCPLVTGDAEFRSVADLELDWIGA